MTVEMWKYKQTSVQSQSEHSELPTKLRGTANTGRGVMKLYESGGAFAVDMGVPVSKLEELIEAHIQTSLKIAQDPEGAVPSVS